MGFSFFFVDEGDCEETTELLGTLDIEDVAERDEGSK
jgi:hypothetical protein